MKSLFVEELESRNLLNGGGLAHQSMPWMAPDRSVAQTAMAPAQSGADFSALAKIGSQFVTTMEIVTVEQIMFVVVFVPEGISNLAGSLTVPVTNQATPKSLSGISLSLEPANDSIVQVDAANLPRSVSNSNDLAALAALENASSTNAAAVAALATALSNNSNPTLVVRAENLAANLGLRAPSLALSADSGSIRAGTEIGADNSAPITPQAPPQPAPQLPPAGLSQSPLATAIRAGLASLPQFADLMNGFSTVDLGGVDKGISAFLEHLEGNKGVALPTASRDFYPWILTGLATAAACELARRTMRKTALPEAVDFLALPIEPWDAHHEHENG